MERLTINRATGIAYAWVSRQEDMPRGGRVIVPLQYSKVLGGRLFSVRYKLATGHIFHLMEFYVLDDGSVRPLRDKRTSFKNQYPSTATKDTVEDAYTATRLGKEKLAAAVQRFFTALSIRASETPKWFLSVEPSGIRLNARGIDVLAYVDIGEAERLKVPMGLRCSRSGKLNYYEKNPVCRAWNIGVVIVNEKYSDDDIRAQTYGVLGEARKTRKRYKEFFRELFAK